MEIHVFIWDSDNVSSNMWAEHVTRGVQTFAYAFFFLSMKASVLCAICAVWHAMFWQVVSFLLSSQARNIAVYVEFRNSDEEHAKPLKVPFPNFPFLHRHFLIKGCPDKRVLAVRLLSSVHLWKARGSRFHHSCLFHCSSPLAEPGLLRRGLFLCITAPGSVCLWGVCWALIWGLCSGNRWRLSCPHSSMRSTISSSRFFTWPATSMPRPAPKRKVQKVEIY